MPDVLIDVTIASPRERIFEAITRTDDLERWWCPEVVGAEPAVGSTAELRFRGGAFVIKIEVTELQPPHALRWAIQGVPDWAGTSVTWELSPSNDGQTRVRFAHREYPSTEGSFASGHEMSMRKDSFF